jgi:hypothetical protein
LKNSSPCDDRCRCFISEKFANCTSETTKAFIGFIDNNAIFAKRNDLALRVSDQGCQMVYFRTENPNLGNF